MAVCVSQDYYLLCVHDCRHRMFKTDLGIKEAYKKLVKEEGAAFLTRFDCRIKHATYCTYPHILTLFVGTLHRGIASNMTAVAFPLAITIFMTDVMLTNKDKYSNK